MFTGIVTEMGRVLAVEPLGEDTRLTVSASPSLLGDATEGCSIAVDGTCLTATSFVYDAAGVPVAFTADVMPQTMRLTALGGLDADDEVNLERALPAGGRLDGHIVQGHVDAVATLTSRTPGPRWDELTFDLDPTLLKYIAPQGSIALSGVSLTVTHLTDTGFGVALIPTTLEVTTLGRLQPGDRVNVEVDVLAKYVERLLDHGRRERPSR